MSWIPCKQKTPQIPDMYLVCYETEEGGKTILKRGCVSWQNFSNKRASKQTFGWMSKGEITRDRIKFWMPFPSCPENPAN